MSERLRLWPVLMLAPIWVLLWGRLTWGTALSGILVAAFVFVLFPMPRLTAGVRLHPVGLVVLVAVFVWDLVAASVRVAWLAVRPRPISAGTVIEVQLTETDDLLRTVVAELTSLVPGTVVIDLDETTGIMTMHVLDTVDPEALDAERRHVAALERRVHRALGRGPGPRVATDRRADRREGSVR